MPPGVGAEHSGSLGLSRDALLATSASTCVCATLGKSLPSLGLHCPMGMTFTRCREPHPSSMAPQEERNVKVFST